MAMIRDWLVTRRKSSKLAGYELGMDCSTKKGAQMPDREQLIRKILHQNKAYSLKQHYFTLSSHSKDTHEKLCKVSGL